MTIINLKCSKAAAILKGGCHPKIFLEISTFEGFLQFCLHVSLAVTAPCSALSAVSG